MHYYQFNIGDYASHTRGLSLLEDLAYRRLIDEYYLGEQPLNGRSADVARLIGMRDHVEEVTYVLETFFEDIGGVWVHERIDEEIQSFHDKQDKARAAGKASAAKRANKPQSTSDKSTDVEQPLNVRSTTVQPTNNHKPITNNQDKKQMASGEAERFDLVWAIYPKREGGNPKGKAMKAYYARIKAGHTHDVIYQGVARYRAWCEAKGMLGGPYVKQAVTFLGPDEAFLEAWEVTNETYQRTNQQLSPVERVRLKNAQRAAERERDLQGERDSHDQGGNTLGAADGVVWQTVS